MKKAILLSGGMDSIALTYWYRQEISLAFTVNYGQKSAHKEIEVSKNVCAQLNIMHEILEVDCNSLGSGEMSNGPVSNLSVAPEWWPYRNQLLITLVSMKAMTHNIRTLFFGAVKTDCKFKDGTYNFFKILNMLLKMQEGAMEVLTPAIRLSTFELIVKSKIPESLLLNAHSCHKGNDPCGICNGCIKYIDVIENLKNRNSTLVRICNPAPK